MADLTDLLQSQNVMTVDQPISPLTSPHQMYDMTEFIDAEKQSTDLETQTHTTRRTGCETSEELISLLATAYSDEAIGVGDDDDQDIDFNATIPDYLSAMITGGNNETNKITTDMMYQLSQNDIVENQATDLLENPTKQISVACDRITNLLLKCGVSLKKPMQHRDVIIFFYHIAKHTHLSVINEYVLTPDTANNVHQMWAVLIPESFRNYVHNLKIAPLFSATCTKPDLKLLRIEAICQYCNDEQHRRDLKECIENEQLFLALLYVLRSIASELYHKTPRGAEIKQKALQVLYNVNSNDGYNFFEANVRKSTYINDNPISRRVTKNPAVAPYASMIGNGQDGQKKYPQTSIDDHVQHM